MSTMNRISALVVAAGCAAPVLAQDSVSRFVTGLPGDAVSDFTSGQTYVVDLVPFTTRANTQFGIAPIVKASKTSASFFTAIHSAQGISRNVLPATAPAAGSYSVWTTAGQGINPANNNAPSTTTPPSVAAQFALAAAEFDGPASNIVGAIVNFDPAAPTRMYVKRVVGATNRSSGSDTAGTAALGFGAIDASGNIVFRADGNSQGGSPVITGNNIFRVDLTSRNNGIANWISGTGASDAGASVRILNASGTTHNVPNLIPEEEGGPTYIGPNQLAQHVRGRNAGVTTQDSSHFAAGMTDHRGATAYSKVVLLGTPGAVGTAAILSKTSTSDTTSINIFDVDANGNPVGTKRSITVPATLQDNVDPRLNPFPVFRFDHYGSQTAFQGGVSQVAIGKDQAGRILVAATVYGTELSGLTNPSNAIAVARLDSPTAPAVWSLAAWNDVTNLSGKPIRDENGSQIGRLGSLFEVTGGSPLGPSFSAPAIDAAGNIWFLATGVYDEFAGPNPDNALFRAVYDASAANPAWTIESVIDTGNVFTGANSGTKWQIRFLEIADSNSVSSGTLWSQNVAQDGFAGQDVSGLDPADPRTNGGVVVAASIIYDRNNDDQFEDPVIGGTPTGSPDEEYNVLLYIGNVTTEGDPCDAADYNGDGSVDILDFLDFFDDYGGCDGQPAPCGSFGDPDQYNPDGFVDILDFLGFFDIFGQCS